MKMPLTTTLVALALGCSTPRPTHPTVAPPWPEPGEVVRVTVALAADEQNEALPEFDLPVEHIPAVVLALTPPTYSEPRPDIREAGRLRLTRRDGGALDVRLVAWHGHYLHEPARFTADGVPCIRGGPYLDLLPPGKGPMACPEVGVLTEFLRSVHAGRLDRAAECQDLLERSSGRKPRPAK